MAANVNILGRIGKDAEIRKSEKTDKEWIRFSICSQNSSGRGATWFEVLSYNTSLAAQIKKGTLVSLNGDFELGATKQDEEGHFWTPLCVVADRVYIINEPSKKEDKTSAETVKEVFKDEIIEEVKPAKDSKPAAVQKEKAKLPPQEKKDAKVKA